MMGGARKKAPKTIAVIDPDRCFGAFACSICQAACPVADCIIEEPDRDGRTHPYDEPAAPLPPGTEPRTEVKRWPRSTPVA